MSNQETNHTSNSLSRYGRHDTNCALHGQPNLPGDSRCTCGFSAAVLRANERGTALISAAPDMFEALEACKRAVEDKSLPASARLELVRDIATPVILKAKGAQ